MTFPERPTNALPCPDCRKRGLGGGARIGNRRSDCKTCNAFAQNVMRRSLKRLKEKFPDEHEAIRVEVEIELYREVIRRTFT